MQSLEKLLRDAVDALNRDDLPRAERLFRAVHHLYPNSASPMIGLAQVALRQKHYVEAESWLMRAGALEPALPEVWKSFVMLYNAQNRLDRLVWALETWYALEPQNSQVVALLRLAYQRAGNKQALQRVETEWRRRNPQVPLPRLESKATQPLSEADLRKLVEKYPQRADYCEAYVELLLQKGRYREATRYLERLIRLQPKKALYPYNLALCYIQIGEHSRALPLLLRARQLGLPQPQVARPLASTYLQLSRYSDALPELEWLYRHHPRDLEILRAYGIALLHAGRPTQAVQPLTRWTEKEPRSYRAWYLLGVAYASVGKSKPATEALDRAIRYAPETTLIRYHRALVLIQAKQSKQAQDELEKLLREPSAKQSPLYPEMGRTLLALLRQQKAWQACMQWIEQLETDYPDTVGWTREKAITLIEQEQYEPARNLLEHALRTLKTQVRASLWELLTETYLREGKSDLAVQVAERALPETPVPMLKLLQMFDRQGQAERALILGKQLLKSKLEDSVHQEVEIRTAKLFVKTGRFQEGIALLQESLKAHPNDLVRAVALARILTDANHTDYLKAWQRVLRINPDHAEALGYRAIASLRQAGNPQLAWNALPILIRALNTEQRELIQSLQRMGGVIDLFWLMEAGDEANRLERLMREILNLLWSQARSSEQKLAILKRWRELSQQYPESQILIDFTVDHCLQLKRPQDALVTLNTVIRKYPTRAWLYFRKGQILSQMGRRTEAREAYLQCLRLDPKHPEARKALESL